jgi:hypothetical protein
MDVKFVGKFIGMLFLCTMAMLGTYRLGVWLGLDAEVAGFIGLGAWVANFFAIEPVRPPS